MAKRGIWTRENILLLNMSRPRTWAFAISSFILAYLRYGGSNPWAIALGILTTALVSASTNLVNAYSDIEEDTLNQPLRASWVLELGRGKVMKSSLLLYGISTISSLMLGPLFAAVSALAIIDSLAYSVHPIRLKTRIIPGLVSFSGAVGLAYLGGQAAVGKLNLLDPIFWIVTFFMLAYGTVKNLPDYPGDKLVGIRTTATVFRNIKEAALASCVLLVSPYFLICLLVSNGSLPPIFMANLLLVPIPIWLCFRSSRAYETASLERLHTIGFVYATSFINLNLILCVPSMAALSSVITIYVFLALVGIRAIDSRKEYAFQLEKVQSGGIVDTTIPLSVSS